MPGTKPDAPPTPARADEQGLLTALTTEHFTLATAKATAVSESNARFSIYLLQSESRRAPRSGSRSPAPLFSP
jgi:hypothetical protein